VLLLSIVVFGTCSACGEDRARSDRADRDAADAGGQGDASLNNEIGNNGPNNGNNGLNNGEDSCSRIEIFALNAEAGGLVASPVSVDGPLPGAWGTGDFDGDGEDELLTVQESSGWTRFDLGVDPVEVVGEGAVDAYVAEVEAVDLDGDGRLDAILSGSPSVTLLMGRGGGQLEPHTVELSTTPNAGQFRVRTGDVNEDGVLDLVYTGPLQLAEGDEGPFHLQALLARGELTFDHAAPAVEPLGETVNRDVRSLELFDVDGDGHLDAVTVNVQATFPPGDEPWPFVGVERGWGDGTFLPLETTRLVGLGSYVWVGPLADHTQDGLPDLVVCSPTGCSLVAGEADGGFGAPQPIDALHYPRVESAPLSADLNGDGTLYLVLHNQEAIYLAAGQPGAPFAEAVTALEGWGDVSQLAVARASDGPYLLAALRTECASACEEATCEGLCVFGACVECLNHGDCATGHCVRATCMACNVRSDCEAGARCEEGQCIRQLSTAHDFVQLSTGWGQTCGLHVDGSAACWGARAQSPEGTFASIDVSAGEASIGCGLDSQGSLRCWGDGIAPIPDLTLTSLSVGEWFGCGVDPDHAIVCWEVLPGLGAPPGPLGVFEQVYVHGDRICALGEDHQAACWRCAGRTDAHLCPRLAVEQTPADTFAALAFGAEGTCGLGSDGRVTCSGDQETDGGPPARALMSIAGNGGAICGLDRQGRPVCWSDGWAMSRAELFFEDVPYQQIDLRTELCALREDGAIECVGQGPVP